MFIFIKRKMCPIGGMSGGSILFTETSLILLYSLKLRKKDAQSFKKEWQTEIH
jgi:hypothetical protein